MFDGSDLELTLSSKISPKAGTLIFLLKSPSATAVVLEISLCVFGTQQLNIHLSNRSHLSSEVGSLLCKLGS